MDQKLPSLFRLGSFFLGLLEISSLSEDMPDVCVHLTVLEKCRKFVDTCLIDMVTGNAKLVEKLDREITRFFHQTHKWEVPFASRKKVTYEEFLHDKILIIAAIRAGIPYSLFELIQHYTPFTENDWADFLDISTKSLQRYRQTSKHEFKPLHSEKIIEMAEVTHAGMEVFGDYEKLKLWLNTPNYALGNLRPIDLLKDSYGKEMVLSELVRISHGILV